MEIFAKGNFHMSTIKCYNSFFELTPIIPLSFEIDVMTRRPEFFGWTGLKNNLTVQRENSLIWPVGYRVAGYQVIRISGCRILGYQGIRYPIREQG